MALYAIEFAPAAARQLGSIPRKEQVRMASRIDALVSDLRPPGYVKLRGSEGIYRIRVGDYRVLYQVRDEALLVIVVKVGKRGLIYKR